MKISKLLKPSKNSFYINSRLVILALISIFLLGLFVRVYKLDKTPPSLNWDEAAAGYNAWTIFHWGRDEWGSRFPLVFTSFRDDKHPVHIYLTAPFVGILGLNEFATRLPAALFSSGAILIIFFLAKKMFKSVVAGLLSAFILAVSPYHIHYSRGLWEVDFALFFFLLGLTLFMYGLEKYKLLYFAFLSFGLSLYSYHSSKLVVYPIIFLLLILYFKKLIKFGKHFYLSLAILGLFVIGMFLEPRLLGLARVKQNSFSDELVKTTWIYKQTSNSQLAGFEIALRNYPSYFSREYLFEKGDQNPRGSVKVMGEFYKIDAIFLAIGIIALLALRSRISLILLAWIMLAPLPAALSSLTPNSTRAMFMMGSLHLLSALGAYTIIKLLRNKYVKITGTVVVALLISYEFMGYINYYFNDYAKKEAIEWQYGMKEVVAEANSSNDYYKVYMDIIRQQPYIFFLYYGKVPLPKLLKTVKYDQSHYSSFNTVASFDKYQFGGWDVVESYPGYKILYAIEDSKYTGLRHRLEFEVVRQIKFPNGQTAFYLVTGHNE